VTSLTKNKEDDEKTGEWSFELQQCYSSYSAFIMCFLALWLMHPYTFSKAFLKLPTIGASKSDLTTLKTLVGRVGKEEDRKLNRRALGQATTVKDFEKV